MKIKFLAALMLLTTVIVVSSCASRKYGCPSVGSIQVKSSVNS